MDFLKAICVFHLLMPCALHTSTLAILMYLLGFDLLMKTVKNSLERMTWIYKSNRVIFIV
jgi:hypothetical protein